MRRQRQALFDLISMARLLQILKGLANDDDKALKEQFQVTLFQNM